jgi:hypothetical protein
MTREEHNRTWGVDRQPDEYVFCHTIGYGEFSQYDPDCPACWLGHPHTWAEHDAYVIIARRQREK